MATLRVRDTRAPRPGAATTEAAVARQRPWAAMWPPAFGARSHRADSRHSFTAGGGEELPIAT